LIECRQETQYPAAHTDMYIIAA